MKRILFIILILSSSLYATNHFCGQGGNDSNDGSTFALRKLTIVDTFNDYVIGGGDTVVCYETMQTGDRISLSGDAGASLENPLVIISYDAWLNGWNSQYPDTTYGAEFYSTSSQEPLDTGGDDYLHIIDISFKGCTASVVEINSDGIVLEQCRVWDLYDNSGSLLVLNSGNDVYIINCLIYEPDDVTIGINMNGNVGENMYLYNNTIVGNFSTSAFRYSTINNSIVKNNIFYNTSVTSGDKGLEIYSNAENYIVDWDYNLWTSDASSNKHYFDDANIQTWTVLQDSIDNHCVCAINSTGDVDPLLLYDAKIIDETSPAWQTGVVISGYTPESNVNMGYWQSSESTSQQYIIINEF
jgi:hypothetical protein